MGTQHTFDVIVIGAGHAGLEAAWAAGNMGSRILLVTLDLDKIGQMSCNPAIGGIGKGHIVFETSAMGGLMGKLCTVSYLQARMLNTRKGPAVQGLRLQIDKTAYTKAARTTLQNCPGITLLQGQARHIHVDSNGVQAVTIDNDTYICSSVVVTTGTFLNGVLHRGPDQQPGGRYDEPAVHDLSTCLKGLGLRMDRLKTGTPARLERTTINYNVMELQKSDELTYLYEFFPHTVIHKHDCFITHTNEKTHAIIAANAHKSAINIGNIKGIPPRYCPSIEDKVVRFADKNSHHIFIEPEGQTSVDMYPNGISTSLPAEVQEAFIRTIEGLQDTVITKYGYAIEYDFVHPSQLTHTLEVKTVNGLFLAGQINGTTGYEEAAGQGLVAGINAHLRAHRQPVFVLKRHESYIGVMIDDLVTLDVDEPYRMFTSRAERRILLRQDNSFERLTDYGYRLGLVDSKLYQAFCQERNGVRVLVEHLKIKSPQLADQTDAFLYKQALAPHNTAQLSDRALLQVYAELKYAPYIERETREIEKSLRYQKLSIPACFNYENLPGLSKELQEKLTRHRPATIAQAQLIPGITPAAISLLIFKLNRQSLQEQV